MSLGSEVPAGATVSLTVPVAPVETRLARALDEVESSWLTVTGDSVDALEYLRETLLGGGKRVRSLLCYWGYVAAHGDRDDSAVLGHVETAGAALEMLHTFALIHDDVMDDSDIRRAHPTMHRRLHDQYVSRGSVGNARRHGEAVAILIGDLAHACADELAAGLPASARRVWRDLSINLMLGQYLDLQGSATGRCDVHSADLVARLKSGDYSVEQPLRLGAVLAGASPRDSECLRSYGRPLGQAFQLRDDIIGVWGDPAVTGKPVGDDLRAGKPTTILALAREHAGSTRGARELLDRVGAPDLGEHEVAKLQTLLEEAGVRAACERRVQSHLDACLAALGESTLAREGTVALEQLAHLLAWRER